MRGMQGGFLSFVKKEFWQILRDRRTVLILLVMPLVLILLFGYAVTTEVKNSKVAVVDLSKDQLTLAIAQEIGANKYFNIVAYPSCLKEAENMFLKGNAQIIILFSENFSSNAVPGGDAAIQILADGSEPNQSSIRVGYLTNIITQSMMEHRVNTNAYTINVDSRMLFNPMLKSEYNFVPGVIGIIIILICAMMTSIAIVREKELGTMEELLVSPLPPAYIIMAKLIPYFLISVINLATILLLSHFMLEIPMAGSITAFILLSLVYIIVSLALGLLISVLSNTQLTAMLLSLLLIVPTIYFSDLVFPVDSMPNHLGDISIIVPTRWFIQAARKLMIQGVGFSDVVKPILILSGMAIALMTLSWKMFKTRL